MESLRGTRRDRFSKTKFFALVSQSLSDSECAAIHGFERSGAGWFHCEAKTISCSNN